MTLDQIIQQRRSVRKYVPGEKPDRSVIVDCVEAAALAPSWKNGQTSRYHIVMSEDRLAQVRQCLYAWNIRNTENVQALVVTTFVRDRVGYEKDGTPSNELGNGWGIYDAGLHNSLFLLKLTEAGFGTLVMGIRDAEAIRAILGIPEQETILSVIAVGYGVADNERPPRKASEDIVTFY